MNIPYWLISSEGKRREALRENMDCDYLIIGGGLTGLTCLYFLSKEGLNPVLIDAGRIGYGSTGRNTGKVTCQHGYIYSRIAKKYGLEKAARYYEINNKAIGFIEKLSQDLNIDCQFKRLPAYLFTRDSYFVSKLQKEYELYQKLSIDCSYEKDIPVPVSVHGALKMNNQAQFHPKRFADALAEEAEKMGHRSLKRQG